MNNCNTCRHKQHPDGGHCYMFRTEPKPVCQLHTALADKRVRDFAAEHRVVRALAVAAIIREQFPNAPRATPPTDKPGGGRA